MALLTITRMRRWTIKHRLAPQAAGLLCACAFLALGARPASGADPGSREYAVKAAFLYKFADYVDWPAAAFGSPAGPLTICILGRDPFGAVLDELTRGERVAGRALVIHRAPAADKTANCQVAYISSGTGMAQALATFGGKPVLTVTDDADPGLHGIISFVIHENRVRFEIDTAIAATSGLAISSKLLTLAAATRGGKAGAP